jgi:hypothetical protein
MNYCYQDIAMTVPVAADGQVVRGWVDKSGVGNHFVSSIVAATFPLWKINQLNALPGVLFDGINDLLLHAKIWTDMMTWFVVYSNRAGGNGTLIGGDNAGTSPCQRDALIYPTVASGAGIDVDPPTLNARNIFAMTYSFTANICTVYLNNVAIGTDTANHSQPLGTNTYLGMGFGEYLSGAICEVIWYNTVLNPIRVNRVTQWLATKYAVSI